MTSIPTQASSSLSATRKLENRPPTVQEGEIYIQRLMAKRIDDALPPLLLKRGRGGSCAEKEGGGRQGRERPRHGEGRIRRKVERGREGYLNG